MIELFEQDEKKYDRQSSKGNQLKWKKNDIWYKADYTGYEGLSEYVISHLLKYTSLNNDEFVIYNLEQIQYKNKIFNGVSSENFLQEEYQIITLERLFKSYYNKSLHETLWNIKLKEDRLKFLVETVEKITGLKDFGKYMNKLLTIDAFFLNEDRHTHNIAVLMDEKRNFKLCPIFDNGAGLLADTTMDYPLEGNIYDLIDSVKAKTFSDDLYEQLEVSEKLYGSNITFSFNKKIIEEILNDEKVLIYDKKIIERVKDILYEQMRKYNYMF